VILNPFLFLVAVYWLASLIGLLYGLNNQGFYTLGSYYEISPSSYYVAFGLDSAVVFLVVILYLFSVYGVNKRSRGFSFGRRVGYFIICHQVAYIIFVLSTGAGVAGSNFSFNGFNIFNYYFILLSPDALAFIITPLLRSRNQFAISISILLVSFLIRGWMGGVLFFIILIIVKFHPLALSRSNSFKLVLSCGFLVLSLPLLESIKWGMRTGIEFHEILAIGWSNFSLEGVGLAFNNVVSRFHHLNNSALIVENLDFFRQAYAAGEFKSYWMNGLFYETMCKFFFTCGNDLNSFVVGTFYDPGGKQWNVDPGVAGWLAILGFRSVLFVFLFLLLILGVFWSSLKYMGLNAALIFFSFTLVYFFHGWFSPYLNLIFYFLIVSFLSRVKILKT
jgi:hypothetical protein